MEEASTGINVLEGLSEEDIARLVKTCAQTHYQPGEAIFEEGDEGEELYIVRTGRVRISKAISLEVDRTLAILGQGGVFGELAMVGEGTRSATARAMEPTEVLTLCKESFELLTVEAPVTGMQIMGRFAATLADRLRSTTNLLRDTVSWGLEVSGAAAIDLHHVMEAQALISVALSNGERVTGRLLKVEHNAAGTLLTVSGLGDDQLHLLPYHAVVVIRVDKRLLDASEEV